MQPESAKYLEDIRDASATIREVTSGRTLADYKRDKLLRLGVERCFEIIGEALRRLEQRDAATASGITDYKRIIGFRNVLIHGYSILQHEIVWTAVQNHLPLLLREVEALLGTAPRS